MTRFCYVFFAALTLGMSSNSHSTTITGTGFLISTNGYMVTNYHVVELGDIMVRDHEGVIHAAKLVLKDAANDLAILKIEGNNFSPLPIKPSSNTKKGMSVFTLGFPNANVQGKESKVTEGIISSMSGLKGEPNSYQISVPIQPGNSGGPLIDESGAVVGITSAKLSASAMIKLAGYIPENVNYAIKSNYLLELLAIDSNIKGVTSTGTTEKVVPLIKRVEVAERSIVFITATREPLKPLLIGQKCHTDADCPSTNCYFGTCVNQERSVQAGGSCTTGAECASDELNCIKRICQKLPY